MTRPRALLLALLTLGLVYAGAELRGLLSTERRPVDPSRVAPAQLSDRPDAAIADAFQSGASGIMVESAGAVVRLLSDDREGSRHQRFIVRLHDGQTVLIAHNIDLAPRVPVATGDSVRFRGQYEWNEHGGVVHWTHLDPQGQRPGGWILYRGQLYR